MASLKLKGFKDLAEIFRPGKFEQNLRKEVHKATKKNALIAAGAIKRGIYAGKGLAPNAPLTQMLKGSSRPLVDTGELVKSIHGKATAWDTAHVGVLRNRLLRDRNGKTSQLIQIAQVLHDGAVTKVTERMRSYFFMMFLKYQRGEIKEEWYPLSDNTKVIVIPKRPYLKFATTKMVMTKVNANWGHAVQVALTGTLATKK